MISAIWRFPESDAVSSVGIAPVRERINGMRVAAFILGVRIRSLGYDEKWEFRIRSCWVDWLCNSFVLFVVVVWILLF